MTAMTATTAKTFFDEDINNEVEVTPQATINPKVIHAIKKLQA